MVGPGGPAVKKEPRSHDDLRRGPTDCGLPPNPRLMEQRRCTFAEPVPPSGELLPATVARAVASPAACTL